MRCGEFECDIEDCRYWREDGDCQKGTIVIQEGRCCDFEEKHKVCVFIEGGRVTEIFSDLTRFDISTEIFDLDDAQRECCSQLERLRARRSSLAQNFNSIYE